MWRRHGREHPSGSSISGIAKPDTPGCLPSRRPDEVREERRTGLRFGESDDGDRCELDESALNRRFTPHWLSTTRSSEALEQSTDVTRGAEC
jgi:hypothetical protein